MPVRRFARNLLPLAVLACSAAPTTPRDPEDVPVLNDAGGAPASGTDSSTVVAGADSGLAPAGTRDAAATADASAAASVDAGTSDTSQAPPPPPPPGKVPMFVAAGHGGRTITSCDDGRTWIANHAFENRNVDHSPYTEKGFVYGNGVFVQLLGWGAPSSVKVSRNGVDWKRVEIPRGGDGGLAFVETPTPTFVAAAGYGGCLTSPNGETWTRCPSSPSYPENMREVGGGGSVVAGGGDIPAVFSFDGGKQWRSGGACRLTNGFGNLGQEGGFAWGNGVFVGVSTTGEWCQTSDLGVNWRTGNLGGPAGGKMAFVGGRFWAPNGRDARWSNDGLTWTKETFQPAGVIIHAMARSDAGTYVGIERAASSNKFYRSTDGITWTLIQGPGGTSLRRVVFGYGAPSAQCPMP